MDINQMRNFIILLKNEGQGYFNSPEEIVMALNAAKDDKFNEEKQSFESTGKISDALAVFKTSSTVTLTTGSGAIPADYALRTNAATSDLKSADIVPESEWISRVNDPIDPPTTAKPIVAIRSQIDVMPISVSSIKLFYLRKPVDMVFGYAVTDDQIVYDAGISTDCDWPSDCHVDIIRRACVYLGIPIDDRALQSLETLKKQTERA